MIKMSPRDITIVLCLLNFYFNAKMKVSTQSVQFLNTTIERSRRELDETKRFLIFPQGSNVQLIYCMTIGTYTKPQGVFTMGVTAGLAWPLPHKDSVPYRKPAEVYHRRSRRELYHKIELMLKTQGKDGKACVLKAICNAAKRDKSDLGTRSFMREILHSIFTLPEGSYDDDPKTEYERAKIADCDRMYPSCQDIL